MYTQKKFEEHLQLCQINKPMILMPSQNKYLQFKNFKFLKFKKFLKLKKFKKYNST